MADKFNRFSDILLLLLKSKTMTLGKKLINYRRKNNYTQQQIADFLEVSQSTYCDWESDSTYPKVDNLIKISKFYDVDLNELVSTEDKVNIINSPNSIANSPNSTVETPEAILKVVESLDKLTILIEKMLNDKK